MRNPNGPTARIIDRARSEPGGVLRWREANGEYLRASFAARVNKSRGETNYKMGLGNILQRYFVKVEGIKGFYVLKEMLEGED